MKKDRGEENKIKQKTYLWRTRKRITIDFAPENNQARSGMMGIPLSRSGLRIRRCHRSCSGCCCVMGSIPGPRISTHCGVQPKKKEKRVKRIILNMLKEKRHYLEFYIQCNYSSKVKENLRLSQINKKGGNSLPVVLHSKKC